MLEQKNNILVTVLELKLSVDVAASSCCFPTKQKNKNGLRFFGKVFRFSNFYICGKLFCGKFFFSAEKFP